MHFIQIELLQDNITFSKSASESPQGTPPRPANMPSAASSTPVPRAKKSVHFSDEMHSMDLHNSTNNHSGTVLAEPTELEYLKNVLYEYMMGKQTQVIHKYRYSIIARLYDVCCV